MRKTKILQANKEQVVIETIIGTDYRFSIPVSIRHTVPTGQPVIISIKPKGEEQ